MKWKQITTETSVTPAEGTPTHAVGFDHGSGGVAAHWRAYRVGRSRLRHLGNFTRATDAKAACELEAARLTREPAAG